MFSETAEELLRELHGYDYTLFFSVGNPLPDCFNIPVEEALKDKDITHVFICEDDMIIPKGILKAMLKQKYPVVALDYPFKGDDATTLHAPDGLALYTGTGFILIERWVLDKMPKPIFRTDTAWETMITIEDEMIFFPRDVSKLKTYGLHDVQFGLTMYSVGIPIFVPPVTAGQRKLIKKGANVNTGVDNIKLITHVWRNNTTKNESPEVIEKFLRRVDSVTTVQILDTPPDNVYYENGQVKVKEDHVII